MLELDALKPVMRDEGKAHSFNLKKEERALNETTTLDDGLEITYNVGGCFHYSFTYHFENVPGGVPKEPEDPFALALSLLDRVPLLSQEEQGIVVIRRAFKEKLESGFAAFENDTTEWACGGRHLRPHTRARQERYSALRFRDLARIQSLLSLRAYAKQSRSRIVKLDCRVGRAASSQ